METQTTKKTETIMDPAILAYKDEVREQEQVFLALLEKGKSLNADEDWNRRARESIQNARMQAVRSVTEKG